MALPYGFHVEELPQTGRDPSVVETDLEIELCLRDSWAADIDRPTLTCGYCDDQHQASSLDGALRWWHVHDCKTLEDLDVSALVWDLGASLPEGHPFAPTVAGRQAA